MLSKDLIGIFPKYSSTGNKASEILKFIPYDNLKFNDRGYEDDSFKRNLLSDIFSSEIFVMNLAYLNDILLQGKLNKYHELSGGYKFCDEDGETYEELSYDIFYINGVILLRYGPFEVFSNYEQIRIFNPGDLTPKSSRNWARAYNLRSDMRFGGFKDVIIGPIPDYVTNKYKFVRDLLKESKYDLRYYVVSLYKSFENAAAMKGNEFTTIDLTNKY